MGEKLTSSSNCTFLEKWETKWFSSLSRSFYLWCSRVCFLYKKKRL